jgi:hypothetical protein
VLIFTTLATQGELRAFTAAVATSLLDGGADRRPVRKLKFTGLTKKSQLDPAV